MNVPELATDRRTLKLVKPDVQRDAPIAVDWLAGEAGRETLRLMGNTEANNQPSTLANEKLRIKKFIEAEDQLTWMMAYDGRTVGVVWAVLEPTEYLGAPAVHIMIGEPAARGQGLGSAAVSAVVEHLRQQGYSTMFSRHLVDNQAAAQMLTGIGFRDDGAAYADHAKLRWQNMRLTYPL